MSRNLLWLAVAALCFSCGAGEKPTRIVLVTFDTLRWDRFDGVDSAMPNLAAAAQSGTIFEDFYAASSSTQPTHATLFTGLHPWQHGVPRNGTVLQPEFITLAERLRSADYHTAAAIASFPLEERFGFAQGFDEYRDDFDQGTTRAWNGERVKDGFYNLAGRVTQEGLDLLDDAPDGDQFMWLHYYDPHSPYGDLAAPDRKLHLAQILTAIVEGSDSVEGLIALGRRLYDLDVEALDAALAPLLERLEADREHWSTHVLFTSDHGESFGEEGSLGHGKRLIRSQVHVPLVVLSPKFAPGRRKETAGSLDVPTTILALAGQGPLPGTHGRDLGSGAGEPRNLFGMRRTFVDPFRDVRTDGSIIDVIEPRFYCARDGRLYIGDDEAVVVEADEFGSIEGALATDDLRTLFGTFSAELEGRDIEELLDPQTQSALQHLGYER